MRKIILAGACVLCLQACTREAALSPARFQNPDLSFAPFVRWWWPGNDVENEELTREVNLFADHHIGGVEIQSFALVIPAAPDRVDKIMSFDTDSFYEHVRTVMEAALSRGVTVDMTNGGGWPASNPDISEAEENRSLQYGLAVIPDEGGSIAIPRSERQDSEFSTLLGLLVAQVADGSPRQIKDVEVLPLQEGATSVKCPAGKADTGWQRCLIALWSVPSQEINMLVAKAGAGKVIDHFDKRVVQKTYDHYFGPQTGLDAYYGKPFRAVFNDSYEFKVDRHISADFRDTFRENRGYDPLPWMPANIWYGYNNMYDNGFQAPEFRFGEDDWRLRYDYDLTVGELIRKHLLRGSSEWANPKGMLHRTQAYGLPMDYMAAAGDADIPETENMMFGGGSAGGLKMVSSGAMLYNKALVSCESAVHLGRALLVTPQKLRLTVDKLLSSGVNQIIWHGAPYKYTVAGHPWQPFYNSFINTNFSSDFGEANVFWEELSDVNLYAQRAQYLMRQGKAQADVLVYYPFLEYSESAHNPEEMLWYGYLPENEPAMQVGSPAGEGSGKWLEKIWPVLNALERRGLTWAWVNDASLQEMTAGKDGSLTIRGNRFGGLVLFDLPYIQLETARNLARQKEANLLVLGNLPTRQPSYKDFAANDALTASLMQEVAQGKHVCRDVSAWKVDGPVSVLEGGERVRMARRSLAGGEWLQICWNEDAEPKDLVLEADGRYAYWFNAEDGSVAEAACDASGHVLGYLPGLSARFLYLTDGKVSGAAPAPAVPGRKAVLTLDKWNLTAGETVLEGVSPQDWRNIPELADCAGEAVYKTTFTLDTPGKDCVLDLGAVYYTAEVFVNGQSAGKRIWAPYCFRVTDLLKPGVNEVEIRVKPSDYNLKAFLGRNGDPYYASIAQGGRMANGLVGPVRILAD